MQQPLIWIIDEEWSDYFQEETLLKSAWPECRIIYSNNKNYLEDLKNQGRKADAVICQISVDMNSSVIQCLDNCKVISVYGAGYNNIDMETAKRKGIMVCNVPGYCVEDVSDYVIAGLYHFNKTLKKYNENITSHLWGAQAASNIVKRLSASTLLVIGCGRIGFSVVRKALGLGMRVLCVDRKLTEEEAKKIGVSKVSLKEGLGFADFVTIHVALVKETRKMMNAEMFAAMKKGSFFINASRGGVVDELALIDAVKSRHLGGALLDVVENEPLSLTDPLLQCDEIKITPHISYLSVDALQELQATAALNVKQVLSREDYISNLIV